MNSNTIIELNRINKEFYKKVASDFDDSRSFSWVGWKELMARLNLPSELKVLDIGCGNGRFGEFLLEDYITPKTSLTYKGVDNSPELLHFASKRLESKGFEFELVDLVDSFLLPPIESTYDLIVLFGVLHHIPGDTSRVALLKRLSEYLSPDGYLVFTTWNFMDDEKLKGRVVDWSDFPIKQGDLEEGDYLLDWRRGEHAYRYCHSMVREEAERLIKEAELSLVDNFNADGKSGKLNTYYICSKAS